MVIPFLLKKEEFITVVVLETTRNPLDTTLPESGLSYQKPNFPFFAEWEDSMPALYRRGDRLCK